MKLSELIATIGDDNVQFQNLDRDGIQLDWSRKSGGKITFGTGMTIIPGEGTERLGLVLWLDRKAVAAALGNTPQAAKTGRDPSSTPDGRVSPGSTS